MKKFLKNCLTKTLSFSGVFPTKMTKRSTIVSLLKKLHPVLTDKPLVRFGPKGDGGYLIPDDILGVSACFSPGVSAVSGFEKDCADRGMDVFLADKSVDCPAEEHERFQFLKKFIGARTDDDFITLDDWVESSVTNSKSELILQIDIEGYEYEVFLSVAKSLMQRFRIIIAEFHRLDQLWNEPFFSIASSTFDKILQTHTCVHIHPNNCCGSLKQEGIDLPRVMEFTFLRNDHVKKSGFQQEFPHPLDSDNTGNRPLVLPDCWFRRNQ